MFLIFFLKTNPTKECLWYTNSRPITSASNRNVKLVIQKTQKMCKIITLITKSNADTSQNSDLCRNQIKIETAYPAELHRMKSNCIRINQNDDNSNRFQANKPKSNTELNNKHTATKFFSSITSPNATTNLTSTAFPISKSTAASRTLIVKNNSSFLKRLLTDSNLGENNKLNSHNPVSIDKTKTLKYASLVTDLIKQLCTDYLKEELIYKKTNSFEYHYIIRINSQEEDLAEIPKLCADYLMMKNKTEKFINELKNELKSVNRKNNEKKSAEYSYYMNSNENLISTSASTSPFASKFKRCYAYRNKPEYKQCMQNYYRCHQFINDAESLKNCRLKFGVTVPIKFA